MNNVIFKARVGSHLFGTSTPSSDVDIKGVFIPSVREILKPKTQSHYSLSTGDDKTKNSSDDVDEEYYALHKFLDMLGKGDMVATEMLFANNECPNRLWYNIFEARNHFLSRECKGFVGYVQRQANVYSVKGDRLNEINEAILFLKNFEKTTPFFKDSMKLCDIFGMHDFIKSFCHNRQHTSYEVVQVNGKEVCHFICCDRKVPYTVTFKTAIEIFQKVSDNYGQRAQAAASAQGHDWKALSHAVRVGEEAMELLATGNLTFPRPNADYLLDIKLGNVAYSKVAEQLDQLLSRVENMVDESVLPEKPDYKFMEDFQIAVYGDVVLKTL